jgi:hypothetical protein
MTFDPSSPDRAARPALNLDFVDFGRQMSKTDNFFTQLLRRRFDVRICDDPDFLIYSDGSEIHQLYTCKKIYWTPEVYRPDFTWCDYALTFHHIDSPRHLRLPLYAIWVKAADLVKQPGEADQWLPRKTEFCCFVASYINEKTAHRQRFFEALSRYKKVHAAGKALNNIGRTLPFEASAKHEFLSRYKFYMAFENVSVPGYTTEKIVEAMCARCVPIYWGNPRVVEEFNPASFINANDFADDRALAEHVARVDQDDALYRRYLEAPFFHDNRPNEYFSAVRVLDFFERIHRDESPPVASSRRGILGRWRLLKAKRAHQLSRAAQAGAAGPMPYCDPFVE